jgi:hypothetical protein
MAEFTTSGFDELINELNDMVEKSKDVSGSTYTAEKVLTDKFVSMHTKYSSFSNLIVGSGFGCKSWEEFDAWPDEQLDIFIRSISNFDSYEDILGEAAADFALDQIGL